MSPDGLARVPRNDSAVLVNGAEMIADPSGALIWPERRVLMVADLHFEKGSSFAAAGRLLPPYDTAATLARLAEVAERWQVEQIICLGDSFHDDAAAARLDDSDAARLRHLTGAYGWTWICGNHDPAPPKDWGGAVVEELVLGPLVLRHEALQGPAAGEVSGHFHPKAAVRVRSKRLSGRCFVTDGRRLILPAFGAYTGGLSVFDPAIGAFFPKGFEVRLIGRERIFAFPKGGVGGVRGKRNSHHPVFNPRSP